MPPVDTRPVDLAGLRLPDARTGGVVDLGAHSGVLVAVRHRT